MAGHSFVTFLFPLVWYKLKFKRRIYVCIYVHVYIERFLYIYTYIHIYTYVERERAMNFGSRHEPRPPAGGGTRNGPGAGESRLSVYWRDSEARRFASP